MPCLVGRPLVVANLNVKLHKRTKKEREFHIRFGHIQGDATQLTAFLFDLHKFVIREHNQNWINLQRYLVTVINMYGKSVANIACGLCWRCNNLAAKIYVCVTRFETSSVLGRNLCAEQFVSTWSDNAYYASSALVVQRAVILPSALVVPILETVTRIILWWYDSAIKLLLPLSTFPFRLRAVILTASND